MCSFYHAIFGYVYCLWFQLLETNATWNETGQLKVFTISL